MKWKNRRNVLIAIGVTMLMTACSGGASPAGGSGEVHREGEDVAPASDGSAAGKIPVTVSVMENTRFLQQAEAAFEQANPGIDIQIQSYVATPDSKGPVMRTVGDSIDAATLEKYRTSVNTELMSGKGADLIAVESLAYEKYAERGMFVDLTDRMRQDASMKPEELNAGVLEGVKVNGLQAALPIHYNLDMTVGNEKLLSDAGILVDDRTWTWQELLQSGEQAIASQPGAARAILAGVTPEDLLARIVQSEFDRYVDASAKTANFANDSFVALLQEIKRLSDAGLIDGNPEMAMQDMDVFKSMQLKRPMELFMFPKVAYRGTGKVYWAPGGGESQGVTYDSELMLAMNRNSKVQEEAWSFLSFLLSEQMQSQPSMDGYPIRKASLKTMLNQFVEMLSKGQIRMAGPSGDTPPAPTEAEIDAVVALAEQVGAFAGSDPQIMNMVKEEAASFFGGAASAEDAAELIQNRVGTYLNE